MKKEENALLKSSVHCKTTQVLSQAKKTQSKIKGDIWILIFTFVLSAFGVLAVYSASMYVAETQYNDKFYFVKKQAIGLVLGVVAMILTSMFDYKKLKKFTLPVCIVSIITLVLVFLPGIGVENYGAKRWIGFGGVTIQPSEIAKFSLILFCATYVSKHPERIKSFIGILPILSAMYADAKMTRPYLASSDGCKVKPPTPIQRVAP